MNELRKIADNLYKCGHELNGLSGLFFCAGAKEFRELNTSQANGVYYFLESLAVEILSAANEIDGFRAPTG